MPAVNPFSSFATGPESPARAVVTITPNTGADQPNVLRQIYVGGAGDVDLIDTAGNTTTHKNVAAGQYLGPFSIARVLATSTATFMLGYI